ncbi:MAG TPA: hypothetical protein VKU39_10335 [Streptosporangiaceae bacterium]|nr:hypothetical protein [Streptosporangiaceae bacterium]
MTADVQQMLTPSRIGQGTAVEQSRAIAEVHAAIVVARQFPRDKQQAIRDMEDACRQMALAERAFFRYNRGDGVVTGPSIHLARQLAMCWGNVQHGITEMRRDDDYGQSEMQAWAWDVETNTRISNTFIVPHKRDTRNGPRILTDQRDIYENNANNAARRLREAIFAVLPTWFTETAKDLCNKTLREGGGKPLPQRISDAIDSFGVLGVSPAQLEDKLGTPAARWTEHDVVQLGVIFKSLRNGEIRKDEEFPPAQARVTVSEITGQPAQVPVPAAAPEPAGTPVPAADPGPELSSEPGSVQKQQVGRLESIYAAQLGFKAAERELTVGASEQIIGRDLTGPHDGRSHANLSEREARSLIDTLGGFESRDRLVTFLTTPANAPADGGDD